MSERKSLNELVPQAFIAWANRPDGNDAATWELTRGDAKKLLAEQSAALLRERLRYHAAHQAMTAFRTALARMGHSWIEDMVFNGLDPADAEEEVRESVEPGLWAAATGTGRDA